MAWLCILLADVFEVAWPFMLKWSVAFSRWSPLIGVVLSIPIMFLLAESVKELPAATVYAAFVGIGTAGTAIIGMAFFGEFESIPLQRGVCKLSVPSRGVRQNGPH
jgi:quaternary ammonium compound-resistance protein SugE